MATPIRAYARDFCRLVMADIEIAPIALIVGQNDQGKSSLLTGVSATLIGDPLAASELTKKEARALVRDGAKGALVEIVTADGVAAIDWPEGRLATKGKPPQASVFAAGFSSIVEIPRKDRAVALAPYLKVSPTKQELADELGEEEFGPDIINQLWDHIERDGWDATHKRQTDNRARAAGRWEQVTGVRFGKDKAKNWRPEGWDPRLAEADCSEEELEQRARVADDQVEKAIANQAVDAAEIARLEALAAQLPKLEEDLAVAAEKMTQAEKELEAAKNARAALPASAAGVGVVLPCAHCGKPNVIEQGLADEITLRKFAGTVAEAKTKFVQDKIAAADAAWAGATSATATCRTAHEDAERAVRNAARAKATLEEERQGSAQAVEAARVLATNARDVLKITRQMRQAEEMATKWELLQTVIEVLAPNGLRQKKLSGAIGKFNTQLAQLCEIAGWPSVELTEDLAIVSGPAHRPYSRLGKSRQWRARVILQLAMAMLDGSVMVVIDEADILDNQGREQLINLLAECEIPAMVAMTLSRPGIAPDLSRLELGATWWMHDGNASPITEALKKAA